MKDKGIGLYIHIPFCKSKCLYCDFPSFALKDNLMIDYITALNKELKDFKHIKFDTVFIGGGTPTYLSIKALQMLKSGIKGLNLSDDVEFSVECNPKTVDKDKLLLLKDMGVNRLSIGLQSSQNNLLKKLGRIHSYDDFENTYYLGRENGFDNINIDLMFGIPGQSLEDLKETLKKVISLSPEHISFYSLIIEENTPFYNMKEKGILNLPGEELERDMYHYALRTLEEEGYTQYEISNYKKEKRECKHNLKYWNLEEYIGVGSSAHSYYNNIRYKNEESIEKYICKINSGKKAIVYSRENSQNDNIEEFMFLGLRKTKGISILEFYNRFNIHIEKIYKSVIDKYISLGILIKKGDNIFLSDRGMEVSNVIMADFILTK